MDTPTPDETEGTANSIIIENQPAPNWARFLAALADMFTAFLLTAVFISLILVNLSDEIREFFNWLTMMVQQPDLDPVKLVELISSDPEKKLPWGIIQFSIFGIFFLYFFISELWFRGSSLGKLMFRLTVVARHTHEQPSLGSSFLRCWLKTLFLLIAPILYLTLLPVFFTKERRCLHDMLSKTQVIG